MRRVGFSLIELMVVIAIIAVLAAVAAPAYMNYSTSARIKTALNTVNSWIKLYQTYESSRGAFPYTACDVGLPSDCSGPVSGQYSFVPATITPATLDDYAIKPYVESVAFSPIAGRTCNVLWATVMFGNYQPQGAGGLQYEMLYDVKTRDRDGIWEQICSYRFFLGGANDPNPPNIEINGCYNANDDTGFYDYQDLSNQFYADCV